MCLHVCVHVCVRASAEKFFFTTQVGKEVRLCAVTEKALPFSWDRWVPQLPTKCLAVGNLSDIANKQISAHLRLGGHTSSKSSSLEK